MYTLYKTTKDLREDLHNEKIGRYLIKLKKKYKTDRRNI